MADRKTTLNAFKTYKALSVGNKNLDKELAEDIVLTIGLVFDTLEEIEEGRNKKVVDFDTLKLKASHAMAYAESALKSVARAFDGGSTGASAPAAKALSRAVGELRTAAVATVKVLEKEFASNKTVQADAALPKEVGDYAKQFDRLVEAHAQHLGVSSDKRDKAYGGYGGKLIEILPRFNGLFTFASPAVAKAHQKYKKEADEAYETIMAGEQLIPDMCKRMVKVVEDKKKQLEKSEKKQ